MVGEALLMSLFHDMNESVSFLDASSKRVIDNYPIILEVHFFIKEFMVMRRFV